MNRSMRFISLLSLIALLLSLGIVHATPVAAHAGDLIPSPGSTAAVDVTNTGNVAEWAGAHSFTINNGHPNTALVRALHKADGIYLRVEISDGTANNNDALRLYFDLAHNASGALDGDDWGVEVTRDGTTRTWGPGNQDSTSWGAIPAANVGVSAFGGNPWVVELRLPTGAGQLDAAHELIIGGAGVGIYFQIFSALENFGEPFSTTYNQWPNPAGDALIDLTPNAWGDYLFNAATTWPDLSITEVRNAFDGPENYRKISHTANNRFQVHLNNPGGTAIPTAPNVRVNLYLAARGIGEPWHRIDTAALLDADCLAFTDAAWPSLNFGGVPKNQICAGNVSLGDISSQSINNIVNNTAQYTVKNGSTMTRLGGQAMSVAPGASVVDVLEWNTNTAQDDRFSEVIVGGTTYRRQHQCMMAEAIFPDDPNKSNNVRQVNMDFVCVPGDGAHMFQFSLGWAEFLKYDPAIGKPMFLQLAPQNMDRQFGWDFKLENAEQIGDMSYVAQLRGEESLPMTIHIAAPPADFFGKTLKENLMVPPGAGGRRSDVGLPSGSEPVHVRITGGTTLWVTNYSFDEADEQFINLMGERRLIPNNGPTGLENFYLERYAKLFGVKLDLLAPDAPLGALVGSFDQFKSSFVVGQGVQVVAPADARYLSLAINDIAGLYGDNRGTGFRVKVLEARAAELALAAGKLSAPLVQEKPLAIVPIEEVMPRLCIQGYEQLDEMRVIGGEKQQLYRHIGDVCWGVINIFPPDRTKEPDRGDVIEVPKPPRPWICEFFPWFRLCRNLR